MTGVGLFPTGINGSTVVGDYLSGSFNPPTYGFVSNGSSFTALEEPASVKSTYVTGISGSTIVGYYPDASGLYDGFVYDGATTVAFGATAGTIVSVSTTEIVASSPAGTPGPVDVTVMTAGMTSATSPADTFAYTAAPTFTSVDTTTFAVGTAGSFSVTASGYPIPTFTQSGPLPSGVTLTSAGVLDGTPADGTGGIYTIVVTATNGISPDALQTLTLAVNQAPAITSVNTTTFTVGTAGSFPATASGYPASTFTESGPLPSGVTLTSAGVLSGTPAAGTGGDLHHRHYCKQRCFARLDTDVCADSQSGPDHYKCKQYHFHGRHGRIVRHYSQRDPGIHVHESGALPAGVILSSAGVLSGTPAAGTGRHLPNRHHSYQRCIAQCDTALYPDGQPGSGHHQREQHHLHSRHGRIVLSNVQRIPSPDFQRIGASAQWSDVYRGRCVQRHASGGDGWPLPHHHRDCQRCFA